MPRRPCLGCGRLITGRSRCDACDTHSQDYGTAYRRQRDAALDGATHCPTCGKAYTADNPATGGHTIAIRNGGRGSAVMAQCQTCNYGHND